MACGWLGRGLETSILAFTVSLLSVKRHQPKSIGVKSKSINDQPREDTITQTH